MRKKTFLIIAGCAFLFGCNGISKPVNPLPAKLPDVQVVNNLPTFVKQVNEVEIADSMNDIDPTFVLGAIVNMETGKVHSLDSFLSQDAKPVLTALTEVVFKNFVENSLTVSASWLDFLKAQVDDTVRAEVSVVKTSKATIKSEHIARERLIKECGKIPSGERDKYAVIIGYVDFVLTAGLFKNFGTEGSASGYGAKIGGKWYSKHENTAAHHRVIAVWAPLPFVLNATDPHKLREVPANLEKDTPKYLKNLMKQEVKIYRPDSITIMR
jgi:hypothetical protein